MAEENNFLTTQNNILIENNKDNLLNDFENLLNPDKEVSFLLIDIIFYSYIVNMAF